MRIPCMDSGRRADAPAAAEQAPHRPTEPDPRAQPHPHDQPQPYAQTQSSAAAVPGWTNFPPGYTEQAMPRELAGLLRIHARPHVPWRNTGAKLMAVLRTRIRRDCPAEVEAAAAAFTCGDTTDDPSSIGERAFVAILTGAPESFAATTTLLKYGMLDPNHVNADQLTLLHAVALAATDEGNGLSIAQRGEPIPITQRIDTLVAFGANVDAADATGTTPLELALASNQHGKLVARALVGHGADVFRCDARGYSMLHRAIERGDLGAVQFLSAASAGARPGTRGGRGGQFAPVNLPAADGLSPLELALQTHEAGHAIVACLLQHGADTHAPDSRGYSMLHRFAERGNTAAVGALLVSCDTAEARAQMLNHCTNTHARTPIEALWCVAPKTAAHAVTCSKLIDSGADLVMRDRWHDTMLHRAIETNEIGIVQGLIDAHPDDRQLANLIFRHAAGNQVSALWYAMKPAAGEPIFALLLEHHRADVQGYRDLALTGLARAAVDTGQLGKLRLLLAEIGRRGLPESLGEIMFAAISTDSLEAIDALIAAGMDPDTRWLGFTALHVAANQQRGAELILRLLAAGADPLIPDFEGRTARQVYEAGGGQWPAVPGA